MLAATNGELGYLLGDSGYPLRTWLVVPFDERQREEMTPERLAFNTRHSQCRSVIERCFGMLKSRYRSVQWRRIRGEGQEGTIVFLSSRHVEACIC